MFWNGSRGIDGRTAASTTPGKRADWVERPSGLLVPRQTRSSAIRLLARRLMSVGGFVGPVVLAEVLRRLLGS
jgi:hypothetical protein